MVRRLFSLNRWLSLLLALVALANPDHAQGQPAASDGCNEILRLGIYDYIRDVGVETRASQIENEICSTYRTAQQSQKSGGASASYGLFSGSISVSFAELSSMASAMCGKHFSNDEATNAYEHNRRVIRDESVKAWRSCMDGASLGIVSVVFVPADPAAPVNIQMSRRLIQGSNDNALKVQQIDIVPPNAFTCTGTLRAGAVIRNGSPGTLTCNRMIAPEPQSLAGKQFWASAATITITTANGALLVPFAAYPVPTPPNPIDLPLGTVVAFAGSPASIPNGWILCDGREVKRSDYPKLFLAIGTAHGSGDGATTFALPDYRGIFLRGVDGNANRDPDHATRTAARPGGNTRNLVGSVQEDGFTAHAHDLAHRIIGDVRGGFGSIQAGGGSGSIHDLGIRTTSGTGGKETRPTNAYVHYIIRAE